MPQGQEIVLRDKRIGTDEAGNVCLNDLWQMADKPENKRSRDWYRSKRVKALENALICRIVEISHRSPKEVAASTYYALGRGSKALTYAHPVLALDYAEYLSPELGVEVRETFLRVRANDVTLALEIIEGLEEQAEYDALRVKLRQLVKEHNKLSAGAAKAAGVKSFEAYNGAGLRGLYGGMTKAKLLRHKGLPADAHHLDHAGHEELAANYFKATQAEAKIRREGVKGQEAANQAHMAVGEAVRNTIGEIGGTMPEDEPALEHIRKAEGRLKVAEPKQELPTSPSLPSKPARPKKRVSEGEMRDWFCANHVHAVDRSPFVDGEYVWPTVDVADVLADQFPTADEGLLANLAIELELEDAWLSKQWLEEMEEEAVSEMDNDRNN